MTRPESFRHAFRGLGTFFANEPNARVELAIAVAVVAAGIAFDLGRNEWCWLAVAITMVLVAEALNTAIELLGNAVSDGKHHVLVGRAKDVAAGGVVLAAMGAVVIGVIIFLPYVLEAVVGERGR